LAQAMINATKIKSNGYSEIKLGSIFSFAEKGKNSFATNAQIFG
jgi:hypothetical protein